MYVFLAFRFCILFRWVIPSKVAHKIFFKSQTQDLISGKQVLNFFPMVCLARFFSAGFPGQDLFFGKFSPHPFEKIMVLP